MINIYSNIIYKNNIAYKILDAVSIQNFLNSNNTVNTKLYKMSAYLHLFEKHYDTPKIATELITLLENRDEKIR